ncbi:xylulokinase [Paenibacillus sp. J2TS4]|nr:xylulokinase [Paenibacillus sp. J2TS4]
MSEAYVPYPSYYPFPRWVEQEPEQWIEAAVEGVHKTLASFTAEQRAEIAAIGFSAPHHVAVLLDKRRRVLRRVIMWNDQRSGEEARYLADHYGDLIFRITNNRPSPTWTLSHLLWLSKHEPRLYEQIDRIVFMKDYVRYRFSGELATDYIEAEGTLLYDIHQHEWSQQLLSLLSLDRTMLPEVKRPTDSGGRLLQEMANRLRLPPGIPIIIGTADTAAEVYGCGTVEEGDGVVKLATAGNFTIVSSELPTNTNIIIYEHVVKGLYYQNSATNFAASSFRWFKEAFYKEVEEQVSARRIYSLIDEEIAGISPGAEGLIFQPYLNGERSPHWDPYLRASFFGLTARHGRPHFARAVLEGVGFSIRDAGAEYSARPDKPIKIIGGGGKSPIWTQMMADILKAEMEVPQVSDASFGNCLLAATGIGWFSDLKEAVRQAQKIVAKVAPIEEHVKVYDELFDIYRELHTSTKQLSHRLTEWMDSTSGEQRN